MIAPCRCRGTSEFIHRECLDEYILYYPDKTCRVCRSRFHYSSYTELMAWWSILTWIGCMIWISPSDLVTKFVAFTSFSALMMFYATYSLFTLGVFKGVVAVGILFLLAREMVVQAQMVFFLSVLLTFVSILTYVPPEHVLAVMFLSMLGIYLGFLGLFLLQPRDWSMNVLTMSILFLLWNLVYYVRPPLHRVAH